MNENTKISKRAAQAWAEWCDPPEGVDYEDIGLTPADLNADRTVDMRKYGERKLAESVVRGLEAVEGGIEQCDDLGLVKTTLETMEMTPHQLRNARWYDAYERVRRHETALRERAGMRGSMKPKIPASLRTVRRAPRARRVRRVSARIVARGADPPSSGDAPPPDPARPALARGRSSWL